MIRSRDEQMVGVIGFQGIRTNSDLMEITELQPLWVLKI